MDGKQRLGHSRDFLKGLRSAAEKGRLWQAVWRGGIPLALGFVLTYCPMPFSVAPLGVAFLCAATEAIPFCLLGFVAAGLLFFRPVWLFPSAALLLISVRLLSRLFVDVPSRLGEKIGPLTALGHIRGRLFSESLYLRMTSAAVIAFFLSFVAIVQGGFRYYDLYGALFSMTLAPVAVFVYAGLFPSDGSLSDRTKHLLGQIAPILTAASVCLSLSGVRVLGLSPAVALAFGSMLALLKDKGIIASAACALLCSVCLGISTLPVMMIALLGAFCLMPLSPAAGGGAAATLAGITTGLLQDTAAGIYAFLSFGVGYGLFLWFSRTAFESETARHPRREPPEPSPVFSPPRLSESFASLSRLAEGREKKTAPLTREEHEQLCDEAFDELCHLCPNCEICWEDNYGILRQTVERLTEALSEGKELSGLTPPPEWQALCPLHEHLWEELGNKENAYRQMRLICGGYGFLADEYAALASCFSQMAAEEKIAIKAGRDQVRAVTERLSVLGFSPLYVDVRGTGRRLCVLVLPKPVPDEAQLVYLGKQLESVLDGVFAPFDIREDEAAVTLQARELARYRIAHHTAKEAAEEVSGDYVTWFRDPERGLSYALLHDGMGKGREAADMAETAAIFLRELLVAGIAVSSALSLLNNFLRHGQGGRVSESNTTVDLLAFNEFTGHAAFYKCGAAPTYIKRGTELFRLAAGTVPLGILPHVDAGTTEHDLAVGDLVFLLSDGVEDNGECSWLPSFLSGTAETDPLVLAASLIEAARARGSRDDCSAIVLRIEKGLSE